MTDKIDPKKAIRQALKAREEAVTPLIEVEEKIAKLTDQLDALKDEQRHAYDAAVAGGWSPQELSQIGIRKISKRRSVANKADSLPEGNTNERPSIDQ